MVVYVGNDHTSGASFSESQSSLFAYSCCCLWAYLSAVVTGYRDFDLRQ